MTSRHGASSRGAREDTMDMDPPPRSNGSRGNDYWLSADGIEREVIQADICRYLGRDALVRPNNYQGRAGYLITAYRNLTTPMINSLKADSAKFAAENRANRANGYRTVAYDQSATFHGADYDARPPRSQQATSGYSGHSGPGRSNYEDRESPSYYGGGQSAAPAMSGHGQTYVLASQSQYPSTSRGRDYEPGASQQYTYDRGDGFAPRMTQEDIASTRAPGQYITQTSGPYTGSPVTQSSRMQSNTAYIDPTMQQGMYVDEAYDVPQRRQVQSSRPPEREHRSRMR